jgi:DNA-directed RNA polymerase sigma subunit (sigma70/sigma32)
LRPREREAVMLDLQEYEIREMSQAMQISYAQVRDILERAKRRLVLWMKRMDVRESPHIEDLSRARELTNDGELAQRTVSKERPARARPRGPVYYIEPPRR